jgi:hypothetical protein
MTDRELMQQALEGLEEWRWGNDPRGADVYIDALRDRLAQPEQEPVAWMVYTQDGQSVYVTDNPIDVQDGQRALPLHPTPPQRPWVGLTDEERYLNDGRTEEEIEYARAIENKLKQKNT